MLVLNRLIGESLLIGDNLCLTVLAIRQGQVKLQLEDLENKKTSTIFTLKLDDRLRLGKDVSVLIVKITGEKQVKLGIDCPVDILVLREELSQKVDE